MITLAAVKVALATVGFRRALTVLHARTTGVLSPDHDDARLIAETTHAVATAAAFFPGRALCLEQSLTLYYHLRRLGIGVDLRLGVRHTPFAAHAWIEYQGAPLHEQRDDLNQVVPVSGSLL
jgi:hypothetical protein